MKNMVSFDIEIAKEIPKGTSDWKLVAPLGISCAALWADNVIPTPEFFWKIPQIDKEQAKNLVFRLQVLENLGYKIVTWNGCGFDFPILAQESGMLDECTELALNHVDLMLLVTFQKGHMLGLNKACIGAGLKGKTHNVVLKSGTILTEMSGAQAPRLWAEGETQAVLTYLSGDVEQTHHLAHIINLTQRIVWTSSSGKLLKCETDFRSVRRCFEWPLPDTSWMKVPVTRKQFIDWMPENITKELLHE